MENVIEVKPIQTQEAQEGLRQAELILKEATELKIENQVQYQGGADILQSIKRRYNTLDSKRKEITKPLDTAKKAVMDLFRKPLLILANAEAILKKGMILYTDEQERLRRERENKLRRQAEAEEARKRKALEERARKAEEQGKAEKAEELREKAEEVSVEAPVLASTVEQPKGVAYKDRWYAIVIDKAKMPIEYLEPNMSMLNKFAQATKGKVDVVGVEFKSEKVVASKSI